MAGTTLGTVTTMAPEVLQKASYGLKVTIFLLRLIYGQSVLSFSRWCLEFCCMIQLLSDKDWRKSKQRNTSVLTRSLLWMELPYPKRRTISSFVPWKWTLRREWAGANSSIILSSNRNKKSQSAANFLSAIILKNQKSTRILCLWKVKKYSHTPQADKRRKRKSRELAKALKSKRALNSWSPKRTKTKWCS